MSGSLVLVRDPDVLRADFDDGVVLYHSGTNQVFELNPSAGLLWQCLDGVARLDDLATDLAAGFGRFERDMRAECRAFARVMLDGALAHDVRRERTPPSPPAGAPAAVSEVVGPPRPGHHRLGPYTALGHCFVVDAPAHVSARLAPVFSSLLGGRTPTACYRVIGSHGYRVDVAGASIGTSGTLAGVAEVIMGSVNHGAVASMDHAAVLHAGAVECQGRGILVPGASGSGKSTLVAALVRAGCGYLTDEAAAIDPRTHEVLAYPKPISLRVGSWPLFPELGRPGRGGVTDGRLIDPERLRPGAVGRPAASVGVVVVTSGQRAGPVTLTRATKASTLAALLANWFPGRGSREPAFHSLGAVVAGATCVVAHGSDLDALVRGIVDL